MTILALVLTALTAACMPAAPGSGEPAAQPPNSERWIPATVRCLHFVYGEDRSTWAEDALPEDHWITVTLDFEDTTDFEFGVMTPGGYMGHADPGVTSFRMGIPPGSVICWAARLTASGVIRSLEDAGVIELDASSSVDAKYSVDPKAERDYFSRARLHLDLDGNGIPDVRVLVTAHETCGFLPESCIND